MISNYKDMRLYNVPVTVAGVGSSLPEKSVSNQEVIERGNLDTTDEWIQEHAGIVERRTLGKGENNFTMAIKAARRAVKDAHIAPADIGLVVVGSETAEQYLPATASLVRDELQKSAERFFPRKTRPDQSLVGTQTVVLKNRLQISGIPAMDINTACASFMSAFATAALFLERSVASRGLPRGLATTRNDSCNCALVIGVDSLFEHQDPKDRDSVIVFGDGAGAVVLSRRNTKHTLPRKAGHPSREGMIHEIVLSSVPGQNAIINPHGGYFKMDRSRVKENILELVTSSLSIKKCKNIDHFFFHQASKRVLGDIAEALHIPQEKIHSTLWNYGNTGAASIPITLDHALKSKKIRKGDRILLCGFGAGYEYVHAVVEW